MTSMPFYRFAFLLMAGFAQSVNAQEVVFTETFENGTASWATGAFTAPGYQPSGGVDGTGYIQSPELTFDANFSSGFGGPASALLFRAQDEFDSSGDAFVGDWIDSKYVGFSIVVRHNAPVPVEFSARFASPNNRNGASTATGQLVPPNEWTEVLFDVSRGSDDIISFGAAGGEPDPYGTIFSNIGNIQISAFEPFGLTTEQTMVPLQFDLDSASLIAVPEPAAVSLLAIAFLVTVDRVVRCPIRR